MAQDPQQTSHAGGMDRDEIERRCTVIEPGVVMMREPPKNDAETYEALIERAYQLGAEQLRNDLGSWALLVDLTDVTARPAGRYLERIRRTIRELGSDGSPVHMAVTQPGSAFLRSVLRFVLARLSPHVSVQATREAAIAICRRKIKAHP